MNKHQLIFLDGTRCNNEPEWKKIIKTAIDQGLILRGVVNFKRCPIIYYNWEINESLKCIDYFIYCGDTHYGNYDLETPKVFLAKLKGEYIEELEVDKVYESKDGDRVLITAKLNRKNQQFIGISLLDFEYLEFESGGFYFSENEESEHDLIRLSPDQSHNIELTPTKTNQE